MQEYVTRAVVLDKQTRGGHADARYAFFTERYGKIQARAVSSRKIVSKLAGHLEPGTLAAVRIIETHGAQVVDALTAARTGISLPNLAALNNLLGEWEPDAELWRELSAGARAGSDVSSQNFSWSRILAILGWDPTGAICASCNHADRPARHFQIARQEFLCTQCAASSTTPHASRFAANRLLLVDE
jgi:recombinational DNA repair protein (RecF pathway)